MKYVSFFLVICVLGLLFSSCAKKENYSDTPAITFNSFTRFCSGSTTDSAYIRVNFTDGDGDIGYPQSDASASPDFFIVPEIFNISTLKFDTITYTSTTTNNDTLLSFAYQIPDITPSGKDKELNGIIQINLEGLLSTITSLSIPNHNSNEFQFKVWIYDRAGHKSNVLLTSNCYTCGY